MIRSEPIAELPHASDSRRLLTKARWIVFGLFLASLGLAAAETAGAIHLADDAGRLSALLVLSATGTTLLSLSRELPGQNVLLAAMIIAVIGGFAETVNTFRAIPFGPCVYTHQAGPRILGVLPWWIPLVWVIAILNSRGVARLILRPWRKNRVYGFRLIALTAVLALLFDLGLEPFASNIKSCWLWGPTRLHLNWCGTPAINFLGWGMTTLIVLAFATPALINKKHGAVPPDYQPLIHWTLLNVLFAIGAATHQLWPAAGLSLAAVAVAVVFAVRGARW